MEAPESISDQVERFEDFCIQKRALEGGIEVVLAKRDAKAVMDVATAERELESTKGDCDRIAARVTRARQGDFETAQKHQMPTQYVFTTSSAPEKPNGASATTFPSGQRVADTTQTPLNVPGTKKTHSTVDEDPPIRSGSLPNQPSDPVETRVPREAQADSQRDTNDDHRIEHDLSDEFLALLVQRYTDLCHERQMMQEEIEDRLEKKERLAMEKLRCARIQLEKIREQAVEAVAALNEASGGDTRVRLPAGALGETDLASPFGSVPKNGHSSGPLPPAVPPSFPPPSRDPTPTAPLPGNTFSKNTTPTTAADSVLCPLPNPPRGGTIGQLTDLISELRRTPTGPPPPPPPPPAPPFNSVTATQQAIFKRYDELMTAAKAAGAAVPMPSVPWPLLVVHAHQYPMQNVMDKHLVNSDVVGFIDLYLRWKGWNIHNGGRAMREDWEMLLSVIPEHKRGGRACVAKVVSILRVLVPNK